jgi:endonuclease/exonuclease/phosphatase (EEP) superfamily protein YafD
LLIGLQGVAVWALIPAYGLAAVALWKSQREMAVVGVLLSATQLALVMGAAGWHGPQLIPSNALPVRVVSANVLYSNPDVSQLGNDIAEEGADVVVLQEVTERVLGELRGSALWSEYPHRSIAVEPLYHGSATFSKFPITNDLPIDVVGYPMILTDMQTPAGTVRFLNVHTVAPLTSADARVWAQQFAALKRIAQESPYPLIMAGDFNATTDHGPLERILDSNLRDVFREAGSGFGSTWPQWNSLVPPVMRLDHVLVSSHVHVGQLTDSPSTGSDHRRLISEIGIPRN